MPTPRFTHLHVHSHYSLLDGLPKIPDLVRRAKELGMDSLALTDHGALYGAIEFYKDCKAQGIKPIIGIETYVAPNGMENKRPNIDDTRYHLILLAKNEAGYRNLLALSTKAHLKGHYYKPRIDKKLLREHSEGLIGLSACLGGEIPRLLLGNRAADAERSLLEYEDIFGNGNFYLEVQNHPKITEQTKLNNLLIDLARKTGAPLVATGDVHYLYKEDAEAQDVLMAINTNHKTLDEERLSMREEDFSMHSPEEMVSFFPEIPEAIDNTRKITESCTLQIDLGKTQLPSYDIPNGKTDSGYLRELCEAGVNRRYAEVTQEIRKRLDYELDAISKTGFSSYFLVVQDFVNWAKNKGIVMGPGRGSAAGSLVAYVLNITNVDPLHYGLLFERFINPERISPPDIDLDFTDLRRDEVLEYVANKYGREHVAQIVTFGTMKARLVVRDVARVLGFPYQLGDTIAKSIPFGFDLKKALAESDELKEVYETNADAKRVIDTAKKLEGVARHASTHACGVVITRDPLIENVPLQLATKHGGVKNGENGNEKNVVTQYEMHAIEDLGLLKIDFLGLRNLSIIESALNLIEKKQGAKLNIDTIPLDDPKAFELFQKAETTGVFQLECLSGNTIVSNTTIKQLFEKRHKRRLEAVYLDEGKTHKNQIIDIVKSGKKETYTVVAENGWHVRATKEHYFMTQDGWKKLEDIGAGERILMKTKAKHGVYNICKTCEKQISGRNKGESNFCYRCSAKFYSNPSKLVSREKIRQARNHFCAQGGKPWNVGMTTENNVIWKATAGKISRALTGVTLEQRYGKEKADAIKKMFSEKSRGQNNAMFGRPTPHRKRGFRPDLGHFVRSSWEADFARILKLHNVKYQYEPQTFLLTQENGEALHYTPDFYTPHNNTFYEIKGWLHDLDQRKMDFFQQQYPQYRFVLINTTKFAEFAMKYKKLIAWECPRIPTEQSFKFISVKEIRYYGTEETYDVLMQTPGNNFVASGFVVHNSGGMRRYLLELKPTELEDIIAMVALYRPGPMELIPTYINRKHGREEVTYLHSKLEPVLKNTYGIGVYQEQMMQIARDCAGYTLPQADTLRKAIGKKIKSLLDEQREKLITGMKANGIDAKTAEAIWELFPPFARYGFNRSHAACYAMVAYQTAYLKAHYPAEFMAALLTADLGDIERVAFLVNECRKMKINVLPPDVNESDEHFTVVNSGTLRFGLAAVKNVGENIVQAIIQERRQNGKFASMADFIERIHHKDLNKKSLESLIRAGALDTLAERGQLIANLDSLLEYARALGRSQSQGQTSLFASLPNDTGGSLRLQPALPASKRERLTWEKELLGLYVSSHPLEDFRERLARKAVPIARLAVAAIDGRATIGGVVTGMKKILTKTGKPMLFVGMEDLSGKIETVVFPDSLERNPACWQQDKILLVSGRLSNRDGTLKLLCEAAEEVT